MVLKRMMSFLNAEFFCAEVLWVARLLKIQTHTDSEVR